MLKNFWQKIRFAVVKNATDIEKNDADFNIISFPPMVWNNKERKIRTTGKLSSTKIYKAFLWGICLIIKIGSFTTNEMRFLKCYNEKTERQHAQYGNENSSFHFCRLE